MKSLSQSPGPFPPLAQLRLGASGSARASASGSEPGNPEGAGKQLSPALAGPGSRVSHMIAHVSFIRLVLAFGGSQVAPKNLEGQPSWSPEFAAPQASLSGGPGQRQPDRNEEETLHLLCAWTLT